MRERVDLLLVKLGLCESRAQAQKWILAGLVRSGPDAVVRKANDTFDAATTTFIIEEPCPYVSRGAFKLLAALDAFQPELAGAVGLDIGASTGGFTDLLLQRGASKIYAVDVGHGQLHMRLRNDPRVVCLEKVNSRYLTLEQVPELVDVLVADVSFISLKLAIPAAATRLKPGGWAFVLVKPQFEAGRKEVGRGGVVKDEAVRQRCVEEIQAFAESALGWQRVGVVPSPIQGPAGNHEFVAAFRSVIPPPPPAKPPRAKKVAPEKVSAPPATVKKRAPRKKV